MHRKLPNCHSPIAELPVVEVPIADLPMAETPIAELPFAELPIAELPTVELPIVELPIAELPLHSYKVAIKEAAQRGCSKRLPPLTLSSVAPHSALLCYVHGYARVRTS